MRNTFAVYIHIPFCEKRCTYCDFVTYAGMKEWMPGYIRALCSEIGIIQLPDGQKREIQSIFLGGGTPSILPDEFITEVFGSLSNVFIWDETCEISIECNPGTLTQEKLNSYRRIGINRLSIGMQTANAAELHLLGRIHDLANVSEAVQNARKAGFDNINLDLIYGLPGQSLQSWEETLTKALDYHPEHLSCYALTIEPGTPLADQIDAGVVGIPDEDLAADMLELACNLLQKAGYAHYEVSNWAKITESGKDLRSKHNLQYWHNDWYYGFGVGAHGYLDSVRMANTSSIEDYINAFNPANGKASVGRISEQLISVDDQMQEEMMLRLRLLDEGVPESVFHNRYQCSPFERFHEQIDGLLDQQLIEIQGCEPKRIIRLTHRGLFLGNRVFGEFIGDS